MSPLSLNRSCSEALVLVSAGRGKCAELELHNQLEKRSGSWVVKQVFATAGPCSVGVCGGDPAAYEGPVDTNSLDQLARILQLSITPVALVSGVGLLLLSMTNRLGRVIDRSRELARAHDERSGVTPADQAEMRILFRRARFLLAAILLISTAILFAALTVAVLFAMYLSGAHFGTAVLVLFGACLALLVVSIGCFVGDVFLSIRWLRLSLGRFMDAKPQ